MEALLARRDRLGLSWAELSRRSGLPVWKLRWWKSRLSSPSPHTPKVSPSFVPVQIVKPPRTDSFPLEVVTPSGFRLRVSAEFDADHLRRVIQALEGRC